MVFSSPPVASIGLKQGPYKAEVLSAGLCDPMEQNKYSSLTVNIIKHKNLTEDIQYKGQIYQSVGPIEMKMVIKRISEETNKDNKTIIMQHVHNFCSNIVLRRYAEIIPIMDSKCYLNPGRFQYIIRDSNKIVHSILTKQFFYSKFSNKVILLVEKTPVTCI